MASAERFRTLDEMLLGLIRSETAVTFNALMSVHEVLQEAKRLESHPDENAEACRIIDRRLQALRRGGHIVAKRVGRTSIWRVA